MIPVQLTFAGLYSYQKSVTIDFQPLLNGGLFGIFGPVGSGKSSILEAIMFVLFDRSTRLNKAGDDRYYNMMNLQSNELSIDFIFKAGPNNQLKYRFYFKAQRHRKDFYKVEVKDRSYYQWLKNDWTPIADSQVLGMTYENFMQTVIIPQGKFREFIDQKPAARTQMLKELFQLQQFDLAPQAFSLLHQVKDQLTYLEGQLSQYQELTPEQLTELKLKVETQESTLAKKSSELNKVQIELKQWEQLQQDFLQHQEAQNQLQLLESESDFYQRKSVQVQRFETATTHFAPKITLQKTYLKELKQHQDQLLQCSEQLNQNEIELANIERQASSVAEILKDQNKWEQQIRDLSYLLQNLSRQGDLEKWRTNLESAQAEVEALTKKSQLLKTEQASAEKTLQQLAGTEQEYQNWKSLQQWWKHTQILNQQLDEHQSSWGLLKAEIDKSEQLISTLKSERVDVQSIKIALLQVAQQLKELQSQSWWQQHAEGLKEGKPCPLCGSEHHPRVVEVADLSTQLQVAEQEQSSLQQQALLQSERTNKIEILEHNLKAQTQQALKLQGQIDQLTAQLEQHQKDLPPPLHDYKIPKDFTSKLVEQQKRVASFQQAQQQLQLHQNQIMALQEELLAKSNDAQSIALKVEEIKGANEQNLRLLQVIDPEDYLQYSPEQIQQQLNDLKHQLSEAHHHQEKLSKAQKELAPKITQGQARQKLLGQQIDEVTTKTELLQKDLDALCRSKSFNNLDEVAKVLSLEINPEVEYKEIAAYQERVKQLGLTAKKLAKKLQGKHYKEELHHQKLEHFQSLSTEVDHLKEAHAGLKHQLKQKQDDLAKKQKFQAEHEQLSVRKDQIQEVSNLLRGNGFINFISSAYLQNLCKMANTRFTQLTGNRLSLELNQQNDFMVRDYLNEGKVRLLKTLSGGQIFQASLCLALALAENVKTMNKSEQSFFFLDEGFGSLDKSSIQVVFETLKTLQKENRVVGIISHVEELQEEIDVFLTVRQIGESGSSIMASWEQTNSN